MTWEGDYFRAGFGLGCGTRQKVVYRSRLLCQARSRWLEFAPLADHLVAVEPEPDLIKAWDHEKGSANTRKIGQVPICWDLMSSGRSSGRMINFAGCAGGLGRECRPSDSGGLRRCEHLRPT